MTDQDLWQPAPTEDTKRRWADPDRRLVSVRVSGLFGRYQYEIPLRVRESRIVFLHGPNGVGKSTLLSMISDYANGRVRALLPIPFEEFALKFDDGIEVVLERTVGVGSVKSVALSVKSASDMYQTKFSSADGLGHSRDYLLPHRRSWTGLEDPGRWGRDGARLAADLEEAAARWDESLAQLQRTWDQPLPETSQSRDDQQLYLRLWLASSQWRQSEGGNLDVLPRTHVALIEADRLLAKDRSGALKDRIEVQLEELITLVTSAQNEFSESTRRLDRQFRRDIEALLSPRREDESVVTRLRSLGETERWMQSLGLSGRDQAESGAGVVGGGGFESPVEILDAVLDLNIRQSQERFKTLEPLAVRLETLRDLVNEFYRDKAVRLDYGGKVRFVHTDSGREVPAAKLSSGEKHIFTLLYSLLFEANEGDLVLIDEPELSLHISWQRAFADALERVGDIRDLNFALATHSPQIIGDRWDQMIALAEGRDAGDEDG